MQFEQPLRVGLKLALLSKPSRSMLPSTLWSLCSCCQFWIFRLSTGSI
ncbi:hypothetical protein OROGR_013672 [Orobanche gracilis]